MKIGVFDSGLGGLTVVKSLLKKLPQYNYIYLGDNARVPYGNRSPEMIYHFTVQALDFLFKNNCQLVIIACNTSTATSLRKIQQEYLPKRYPDRRVLGVIKPVVEEISEKKYKRIGVVGTKATVNSGAFYREIKKVLPTAEVFQQPCPLLVPFIEDSGRNKKILQLILKEYLNDLIVKDIDCLLLACTHYEIIQNEIEKEVGKKINVISEGRIVAEKLKNYLSKHSDIENKLEKNNKVSYYVTDFTNDFKRLMKLFLGDLHSEKDVSFVKIDR